MDDADGSSGKDGDKAYDSGNPSDGEGVESQDVEEDEGVLSEARSGGGSRSSSAKKTISNFGLPVRGLSSASGGAGGAVSSSSAEGRPARSALRNASASPREPLSSDGGLSGDSKGRRNSKRDRRASISDADI